MSKIVPRILGATIVILIFISTVGCKKDGKKVDLSSIEINTELFRFEQDLVGQGQLDSVKLNDIKDKHPIFYPVFNRAVLRSLKGQEVASVEGFRNYIDTLGLYKMCEDQFGDFSKEMKEVSKLQKRMKYYFPDFQPLNVVTMISGFNYKNILTEDGLGIGLDMYLNDLDYTTLGDRFFEYQLHTVHPDYLPVDAAMALVQDYYPDKDSFSTLLDRMMYHGKHAIVTDHLLPNVADHLILGMTEEEYKWCKDNRESIWKYFVSENLLYNNDFNRIKTYLNDGPFSAGMPEESPAKTGAFIGWEILKSYQKQNKEMSLKELLSKENSQEILTASKFNP